MNHRKWKIEDRMEPLTPEEQELAATYHGIIFEVLHACGVRDTSDYYDIAVMYYLKAIKKWCNTPALWEKYEIRQVLFAETRGGVSGHRVAQEKRSNKYLSFEAPMPGTRVRSDKDSNMTLENCIGCGERDFDYIFDDKTELDREQVKAILAQKIKDALANQQYEIAVMYGDSLTIGEIAAHLGIARGTVGSTMNVVRRKVAKMDLPEVKILYGNCNPANPFNHKVRQPISEKEMLVLNQYPDCLSKKQYTLFSMYARGMKHREIAEVTGVKISDLSSRISKIRKMIASLSIPA